MTREAPFGWTELLDATASQSSPPQDLQPIEEIAVLWITASLGCDGESVALTGQRPRALIEQLAGGEKEWLDVEDTYRILVEQIPAVVFLAFFDKGISEA